MVDADESRLSSVWMLIIEFWWNFHRNLSLQISFTIRQPWFSKKTWSSGNKPSPEPMMAEVPLGHNELNNATVFCHTNAKHAELWTHYAFSITFSSNRTGYFYFIDMCNWRLNWQLGGIGSGNDSSPNRRQAITWTNDDPVVWQIDILCVTLLQSFK